MCGSTWTMVSVQHATTYPQAQFTQLLNYLSYYWNICLTLLFNYKHIDWVGCEEAVRLSRKLLYLLLGKTDIFFTCLSLHFQQNQVIRQGQLCEKEACGRNTNIYKASNSP